jgi:hypothetical protein
MQEITVQKQLFKLRAVEFGPPGADGPHRIPGVRSIEMTGDGSGLDAITVDSLDASCREIFRPGRIGKLSASFDLVETGEVFRHDYGRMEVMSCHPNGSYEGLSSFRIVLVPTKG